MKGLTKVRYSSWLIVVLLMCTSLGWSQQETQYTQYMYNTLGFNPGYAGSRGAMSTFALHREQWIGLEGAPVTSIVAMHSPAAKNVGWGVTFLNDKIGPSVENNLSADFSYTLDTEWPFKV